MKHYAFLGILSEKTNVETSDESLIYMIKFLILEVRSTQGRNTKELVSDCLS
jgi:hypothetical protein